MSKVMTAEHEPKHPGNTYCYTKNEFDMSCALKVLLIQLFLCSVCSVLFRQKAQFEIVLS